MTRSGGIAAVLATLALCLLPGSAVAQERTISVAGDATLTAANDTARASFSVEAVRSRRTAAQSAASARLRRVIAALRANGVQTRDLRTGSISVRRERVKRRRGGRVTRYRATQGVRATIRPASSSGPVVDAVVRAGGIVTGGPEFFVADERALRRRALTAAFGDARAKAAALAAQAGLTLGRPLSIRDSAFVGSDQNDTTSPDSDQTQPVSKKKTESAPVRPGRSTVDATVYVVFEAN